MKQAKEITDLALIDPDTILTHVANGGTLKTLTNMWNVSYSVLHRHVLSIDPDGKLMAEARRMAEDRDKDMITEELRKIVESHATDLYDDNGTLKPVSQWPKELIAGIELEERVSGFGKDAEAIQVRKVKLVDKLRALEMLGKERGMFNKSKVDVTMSLEQLVQESWGPSQTDRKDAIDAEISVAETEEKDA